MLMPTQMELTPTEKEEVTPPIIGIVPNLKLERGRENEHLLKTNYGNFL